MQELSESSSSWMTEVLWPPVRRQRVLCRYSAQHHVRKADSASRDICVGTGHANARYWDYGQLFSGICGGVADVQSSRSYLYLLQFRFTCRVQIQIQGRHYLLVWPFSCCIEGTEWLILRSTESSSSASLVLMSALSSSGTNMEDEDADTRGFLMGSPT